MRFAFPISKTEKLEDGRLLIEGVATSEALDCQGDILDFEGSKRAFEKWRGNLREAHDPKKPVGRAIEVIPDDVSKSIAVRAFISAGAQDTQAKCLDGTLAMFSVGGGAPTKTKMEKSGVRRVLEWPMTELSLVDVGANPDAAVSVLKAAGMEGEEEEGKPPVEEKPEEKPDEVPEGAEEQTPEEKSKEPVQLSEAQMTELVTKVTDAVLAAIKAKTEEPAKTEQPPAEPPAEKTAPEPEVKKVDDMAPADIRTALDALAILECLRSVETMEVAEGIPEPPEQVRLLDEAIRAVKAFVASEASELIEAPVAAVAEKAARVVVLKAEAPVDLGPILARFDALEAIQKSAPSPDPRLDAVAAGIDSISQAVSDLKADTSGEVKALRKIMDQILSLPIPGRAPLRTILPEMLAKSDSPNNANKANALRAAAQGAPPSVRDYLLNEAAAIERS